MPFTVGGRTYSDAELISMPVQDFMALQSAMRLEQEVEDGVRGTIPPPEPEVMHEVTFSFKEKVLGNSDTLMRNVEASRLAVKRILDRSLHADVEVHYHFAAGAGIKMPPDVGGPVTLTTREVDAMEGAAFERDDGRRTTVENFGMCSRGDEVPESHIWFPEHGAPWHRHVHGVDGVTSAAKYDPTLNDKVSHCLMDEPSIPGLPRSRHDVV